MLKNFPNRKSCRLKGWDYSWDGWYFVNISTFDSQCFFGEIIDKEINLSKIGRIAKRFWRQIPKHFDNASLDEFVIMPNHLHGIVVINNDLCQAPPCTDAINRVRTRRGAQAGGATGKYNPMLNPGSLSKIIHWYKGRVSYETRKLYISEYFAWHPRFYDRIIRSEKPLNNIRRYIIENPMNWERERII